tara:strand:- start:195 stop:809 length:615 start_codon:yes stop_codon:yes gene_type:complete
MIFLIKVFKNNKYFYIMTSIYTTQNSLLLNKLLKYYENKENITSMLSIINGESSISLRIVDWFVTNFAKEYFTHYEIDKEDGTKMRFKVYNDYKLKLKAYSKKRFDPFCRWERINIPYMDGTSIQTTLGQLNFFKWALENNVIKYISDNYKLIERDMNERNSTSKNKSKDINTDNKTRKKREELSLYASRSIKKENVEIVVSFN